MTTEKSKVRLINAIFGNESDVSKMTLSNPVRRDPGSPDWFEMDTVTTSLYFQFFLSISRSNCPKIGVLFS